MKKSTDREIMHSPSNERDILLGPGLAKIPERLLLAHVRGQVLFIAGAGISQPSHLPDFRNLVLNVYKLLDSEVYKVISNLPHLTSELINEHYQGLTNTQVAEVRRFIRADFDVVLGMLERRMDYTSKGDSLVRKAVVNELRLPTSKPANIHRALMRLADRGGAVSMVTTNLDLLLEDASKRIGNSVQTYALDGIPRPSLSMDFNGVMHIHGALERKPGRVSSMIITDHDFGEFYLRKRIVPDFIYDAARLFYLVLVGYSANDPPMKYLFNAIAADGSRFNDINERFIFIATDDPVELEDWQGRGITPISYKEDNHHSQLLDTLERWAFLLPGNGKRNADAEVKRIVSAARNAANDSDRDLFDHLIRRSDSNERIRYAEFASKHKADHSWLEAIVSIMNENDQGVR
jgi:hypothetical protein